MEWRGRRGSRNIEDRRASTGAKVGGVGGVGVIAVLLIGYFLGIDVTPLLQDQGTQSGAPVELTQADREAGEFVSVTLADTEEVWAELFRAQLGRTYRPATLVLFKGVTQSPCGGASGATGPFYCPADKKAYLDTEFFTVLDRRLGAKGEFAAAYVVAHEIAHHVQNELGILGQANQLRQQVSQAESNAISVRIELQADCLSGVWARTAAQNFGTISRADIQEAVNAARQIGDDTLQKAAGKRPMPHTFTHGTADQRSRWFVTGFQSGQIADCDTFSTDAL
ncbi:MAG: neutral zinc metallopeptidase [Pseudotabrizicola sp.]|uniref:KPN_02809 family neutral zinc metallopeptidase n=1 Tax=Pseudotabrizicola sp. TaxID=2939647 RepID=UPI00271F9CED|nr:neutral zinc metallopeptidase [Pseudotabrizicola sp.]MDO8882792.1 neutral zinc metallopeptidase [Pseudotabrizicola sp.]MDP2082823.1 neutral zinc metallopeptidase [Pseudotabrizicola sp.]MDZ7576204.1 neutral zinc metallopeptidase [Pseudotabrizicola sp.]